MSVGGGGSTEQYPGRDDECHGTSGFCTASGSGRGRNPGRVKRMTFEKNFTFFPVYAILPSIDKQ